MLDTGMPAPDPADSEPTPSPQPPQQISIQQSGKRTSTRRHTTTYGSLATERTKKDLLDNPRYPPVIHTREQAWRHLVEHSLATATKEPSLSDLAIVLLNLACNAPGITAVGAEVIRAVALMLDTYAECSHTSANQTPLRTTLTPTSTANAITQTDPLTPQVPPSESNQGNALLEAQVN